MSPVVTWASVGAGVILLLLLMRDVYATVFVPRGQAGPAMERVYGYTWSGAHWIVGRVPRPRVRRWLSAVGPLLVSITFIVWGLLLIGGYALIFYPWADRFAPVDATAHLPRWATALYYSGYAATTLGVGDVYPQGTALRLLAVFEAAQGFALFSVSVTYLLSIYGTLSGITGLALEISRFTGTRGAPEAANTLVAADEAGEQEVIDWFQAMLPRLSAVIVAQGQYPLLHYFHSRADERAFPLAVGNLLELATIARTVLSPSHFPALTSGPTTAAVLDTARDAVHATLASVEVDSRAGEQAARECEEAFRTAYSTLAAAGLSLRAEDEARVRYIECRSTWDEPLALMRAWFSYPTEGTENRP